MDLRALMEEAARRAQSRREGAAAEKKHEQETAAKRSEAHKAKEAQVAAYALGPLKIVAESAQLVIPGAHRREISQIHTDAAGPSLPLKTTAFPFSQH